MKTFLQGLTGVLAGFVILGGVASIKETLDTVVSYKAKVEQTNEKIDVLAGWLSNQSGYVERR